MTTATAKLTVDDIRAGYESDEWLGFGYLGERQRAADPSDSDREPMEPFEITVRDEMILFHANRLGWSREQFFAWLNSRSGRYAGDVLFGSPLGASTDPELRKLMSLEGIS